MAVLHSLRCFLFRYWPANRDGPLLNCSPMIHWTPIILLPGCPFITSFNADCTGFIALSKLIKADSLGLGTAKRVWVFPYIYALLPWSRYISHLCSLRQGSIWFSVNPKNVWNSGFQLFLSAPKDSVPRSPYGARYVSGKISNKRDYIEVFSPLYNVFSYLLEKPITYSYISICQ